MAQLHRFVKLNDRFDTQVFTFILPSTLIQQTSPDVLSREFVYGNQKWRVCMMRNDKHLSAYLTLNNASDGLTCVLDFSFTMINNEHFTRNDMYIERNCKFTSEKSMHGRRTFIGLSDLQNRGFLHFERHFVVELEVRNARNVFEQVLQLPKEGKEADSVHYTFPKYETMYFSWGLFDWNLSVYPFGDCAETDNFSLVYLIRQTSFDHLCRVRYRITLGTGDRKVESSAIEQIIDISGTGTPYESGYSIYQFANRSGKLHIKIELLAVTAISEVELQPFTRGKNKAHLYDRDKQAWMLEADVSLEHLRTRIYYADVYNVPRKFMRFVSWGMNVVPTKGHTKRRTQALGTPFCNYYVQTDTDEGFDMVTDIPVEELKQSNSAFMDEEHKTLTLHVEWIDSHLLYHTKYHRLDEASSRQKHQMWREIMALQAENYALEKQVFSYQQSIAKIGSRTNLQELGTSTPKLSLPDIDGQSDPLLTTDPDLASLDRERDYVNTSSAIATATAASVAVANAARADVSRDLARERDLARDVDGKSDKSDRSRGRDRSGSRRKSKREKHVDGEDFTKSSSSSRRASRDSRDRYDHYGRYDDTKDGKYDFGKDGKYEDTRNTNKHSEVKNGKYNHSDSKHHESKYTDSKYTDSKYAENTYSDSKYADTKYSDSKYSDTKYPNSKYSDSKYADTKSVDSSRDTRYGSSRRGSKYDTSYDTYDDTYDRYDDYDTKFDSQYSDRYADYDQGYDRTSLDQDSTYDLSPYDRSNYSRNSYDRY